MTGKTNFLTLKLASKYRRTLRWRYLLLHVLKTQWAPILPYQSSSIDNLNIMQVAAGGAMFHMVVDTDEQSRNLLNKLAEDRRAGRVTILPLNRLKPDKVTYPNQFGDDAKPLSSYIKCPAELKPAIHHVRICVHISIKPDPIAKWPPSKIPRIYIVQNMTNNCAVHRPIGHKLQQIWMKELSHSVPISCIAKKIASFFGDMEVNPGVTKVWCDCNTPYRPAGAYMNFSWPHCLARSIETGDRSAITATQTLLKSCKCQLIQSWLYIIVSSYHLCQQEYLSCDHAAVIFCRTLKNIATGQKDKSNTAQAWDWVRICFPYTCFVGLLPNECSVDERCLA